MAKPNINDLYSGRAATDKRTKRPRRDQVYSSDTTRQQPNQIVQSINQFSDQQKNAEKQQSKKYSQFASDYGLNEDQEEKEQEGV